jgi:hypothetical protein
MEGKESIHHGKGNVWDYLPKIEQRIKELEDRILEIERTAVFNAPSPAPAPAPEETVVHAEIIEEGPPEPEPRIQSADERRAQEVDDMMKFALEPGTKCLYRFQTWKYDSLDYPGRPNLPDIPVTIIEFTGHRNRGAANDTDPYKLLYEIQFPFPEDLLDEGFTDDQITELQRGWRDGLPGKQSYPTDIGSDYKSGKNKGQQMQFLKIAKPLWGNHFSITGRDGAALAPSPRPADGSRAYDGYIIPYKKASSEEKTSFKKKKGTMKKENKKKKKSKKKKKK